MYFISQQNPLTPVIFTLPKDSVDYLPQAKKYHAIHAENQQEYLPCLISITAQQSVPHNMAVTDNMVQTSGNSRFITTEVSITAHRLPPIPIIFTV